MVVKHIRRSQTIHQFSVLTAIQMVKLMYSATTLACNSDREFSQEKLFYILKTYLRRMARRMFETAYTYTKNTYNSVSFDQAFSFALIALEKCMKQWGTSHFVAKSKCLLFSFPSVCTRKHLCCSPLYILHPLLYSHLLVGCSFFTFIPSLPLNPTSVYILQATVCIYVPDYFSIWYTCLYLHLIFLSILNLLTSNNFHFAVREKKQQD